MNFGKSIKGALSYNERKVRSGDAELIMASRFACDVPDLNFSEKLARFQRINEKNPRIETNTLHLCLNFSRYDNLSNEKLQSIAYDYMVRIGFENQPYLVYMHKDTNLTHLHIVSTTIRPDGKPIYLHDFAKRLSEPARKAIEQEFVLIPAESMKNTKEYSYSDENTKGYITNTVRDVIAKYQFTTLDELNAILRKRSIIADPGTPGSRMHQHQGLIYSKLDKLGRRKGTPIKASSIYTTPTLALLEKKFKKSVTLIPFKTKHAKDAIDNFFSNNKLTTQIDFVNYLSKRKINCEFLKEPNGQIQDIRFVDHFSKAVFTCTTLEISPNDIFHRFTQENPLTLHPQTNSLGIHQNIHADLEIPIPSITSQLLQSLFQNENIGPGLSPEFLKKKKKKKRGRSL